MYVVCYVAMFCHILQGSGYSTEKLRQYQLNRLKYYYAVVECDSAGMKYSNWCTLPIILAHVGQTLAFDQYRDTTMVSIPKFLVS